MLKNPNNSAGYIFISGDLTTNSYTDIISVHATDWVNASYKVQACNSSGCTDSNAVFLLPANSSQATGYFKASNTGAGDGFGSNIALSKDGNTLAVGAYGESSNATGINGNQGNNSAAASGAVYVFARSGTVWTQQAYIKASNTDASDLFGYSVALSNDGSTLAVGASGESSNATGINSNQGDNSATASGAVYVFARSGTVWTQQAYVKASNTDANDLFGDSVTLSGNGNTLVVGAGYEASSAVGIDGNQADNSLTAAGAVYVFVRSGVNWSQQAYVKASNTGWSDVFGYRVGLTDDGNTLAVSAISEGSNAVGVNGNQSDNSLASAGAVYMFVRSGTAWSQQAYVKASNSGGGDFFGSSVALSSDGNTLAVGAFGESSNATGVNGNQADDSVYSAGAVYVFTRTGSNWSQQTYVKASNSSASGEFGHSVALSSDGNTLAVGASGESSNAAGINGNQTNTSAIYSGAVYVFARNGINWSQSAYVKASNPGAYDRFGISTAMSSDNSTLVVGADSESTNATGINGNQTNSPAAYAGAVYVY